MKVECSHANCIRILDNSENNLFRSSINIRCIESLISFVFFCCTLTTHIEMNELTNESQQNSIQQIRDRIEKISFDQLNFIEKLEEWRHESHRLINQFCDLKRDEYLTKVEDEMNQLKQTIDSFSFDCDASNDYIQWTQTTIQSIQQQLDQLQQIQYQFGSFQLDPSLISIPEKIIDSIEHPPSPFKDLSCSSFQWTNQMSISIPPDHWYSLASNQQSILAASKSDLILFDHNLNLMKKKSLIPTGLKDICWSTSLAKYILIFPREILLVNPNDNSLLLESISIVSNNEQPWERGTTHQSILFLSTFGDNPLIVEYNLSPSIHSNKRYPWFLFTCQHEIVNDLKANNDSLGLVIENSLSNLTRLDIRSIKSFDCLHSIEIGKGWGYRCSSSIQHWILTDSYNQRILFIEKTNIYKTIEKNFSMKLFNVAYLRQNQFLLRTNESIQRLTIKNN